MEIKRSTRVRVIIYVIFFLIIKVYSGFVHIYIFIFSLYEFFSEAKCKRLEKGINFIKLSTPFSVKQTYHEAGWDSYCAGELF